MCILKTARFTQSPEFLGVYKDQQLIDAGKISGIYLVAKTPKTTYNSYVHKDSYQSG